MATPKTMGEAPWRTCSDERVCEACREREGITYEATGILPPPHPDCTNPDGCRCYIELDGERWRFAGYLDELMEEARDANRD